MLNISDTTLEINTRFFEAIATLKKLRLVRGLSDFARRYKVVLGNLYTIKSNQSGAIKTEYLHHLVNDFGVSADWLLTGRGEMFRQNCSRNLECQNQENASSESARSKNSYYNKA